MHKRLIFEGVLLILIFGSVWGIFTLFPIRPQKTSSVFSVEKEEKLGNLLLKATLADPDFREADNDTLSAAIDIIKERLTGSLEGSRYTYSIVLVNNDMANAFALPGGYLLITTGLMAIMNSPEECAAVVAHEIGHIEKKHTIGKLLANFTAAILITDNSLASEAAEMLTTSAYSRRQEEAADRFGLSLLEKSKINPHIMGTAFRHLKEAPGSYDLKAEIIQSHPNIDSRIRNAYDYPVIESFAEEDLRIDWESVKRQVTHPKSQ